MMAGKLLYLGLLLFVSNSIAQPIVEVEQGLLMGKTVMFSEHEYINIDRELSVYEGVPFAEPPERFEYPVKKTAWDGTYNATYVRLTCYQESLYTVKDELEASEDCLYLNIYVPPVVKSEENPLVTNGAVMVWIHGGGFSEGSGQQSEYNGEPLSAVGEVIHVNVNYRLATFGYLTTGDSNLPGNYGMMDQVEALRWIQTNIHAFGGDPNKVTIFGESAGSASVSYLLLSKLTTGLFSQAVMESGTTTAEWALQETSQGRDIAFKMGAELGCTATDTTELRQCLKAATTKELYDAGQAVSEFVCAPCIDNYFLDDYPMNLLKRQEFHRVPVMLGSNADEGTLVVQGLFPSYSFRADPPFISKEVFQNAIRDGIPNPLVEDSIYQQYLDWTIQDQEDLDYFIPFVDINTDIFFAAPTDVVARAHAIVGDEVFLYQMTHRPTVSILSTPLFNPDWLGCGHAEELTFVFGFPFQPVNDRLELTGPEKELSVKMIKFWTKFAKTGTPSMSSDPEDEMYWPRFTIPELNYKVLALNLTTDRALKLMISNFGMTWCRNWKPLLITWKKWNRNGEWNFITGSTKRWKIGGVNFTLIKTPHRTSKHL